MPGLLTCSPELATPRPEADARRRRSGKIVVSCQNSGFGAAKSTGSISTTSSTDVAPSSSLRLVALPRLGEALARCGSAALYKAALARCFHRAVREEVDFFVDFGFAARTTAEARAAYLATLRHVRTDFEGHAEDYRRAIATLDLPVLLIHGRQDRVVPPAHCTLVADGFARATVRWVEECGHFPQLEQAETVNRWLVDFLVGRPAPR